MYKPIPLGNGKKLSIKTKSKSCVYSDGEKKFNIKDGIFRVNPKFARYKKEVPNESSFYFRLSNKYLYYAEMKVFNDYKVRKISKSSTQSTLAK